MILDTAITEVMGHLINDLLPPSAAERRSAAQIETIIARMEAGFGRIQDSLNKLSAQLAQVQVSIDSQAFNIAHNDLRKSLNLAEDYLAYLRQYGLPLNPLSTDKYAHVQVNLEADTKAFLSRDGIQCAPGTSRVAYRQCRTYADVPLVLQAMLVQTALYYRTQSPPPPNYKDFEDFFAASLDPHNKDSLRSL